MPIDPSIVLGVKPIQIESPVNQLGQILQIQGAQQANQLNSLKMDEYSRGVESQNRLRSLLGGLGSAATDEQRINALRGGGYFDQADKLEGGVLARKKTDAEVGKIGAETKIKDLEAASKIIDIAGNTFGYVMRNPTIDNAMQAIDYLVQNSVYTPEQGRQYKSQVQANPQSIGQLAETAYRSALNVKDQLAKIDTMNAGNRQVTQSVDPVTGKVQVLGAQDILQSADNAANNARIATEGAANRRVTMRGQDMTSERAREANAVAAVNKSEKPLTEGQAKSALFGSRMAMANKIFDTLAESGATTSTPGMNTGFGVGSVVNALSGADQQQLMQAKRDFLNAVLRRESGAVIGESEFENGNKQYFPQIGDSKEVVSQKKSNREAAMRGVLVDVPENRRAEIVKEIIGPEVQKQPKQQAGPKVGTVQDGYRFKGGNPADQNSWEKM